MGGNSFNEIIARNIKFLLREKGLTDRDLARASNISKSTLSRILNNSLKTDVDQSYINAIAEALEVDEDILTETNRELKERLDHLESVVSQSSKIDESVMAESERLVSSTKGRGVRERARAMKIRGMVEYQLGHYQAAVDIYTNAHLITSAGGDEELELQIIKNRCEALLMIGRNEEIDLEITKILPEISDPEFRARILFILGSSYYKRGEFSAAKDQFELALILVPETVSTQIFRARCQQSLGGTLHRLGQLTEALNASLSAAKDAEKFGDRLSELYALQVVAEVQAELGLLQDSVRNMEHALELAKRVGRRIEIISLQFSLAIINRSFDQLLCVVDQFESVEIHPRDLADMYKLAARLAFENGKYETGQSFYEAALSAAGK